MNTTYIYAQLQYYFSNSQIIDYELGVYYQHSLQYCLSKLQQTTIPLSCLFSLFSSLWKPLKQQSLALIRLNLNQTTISFLISNDALQLLILSLNRIIRQIEKKQIILHQEMKIKIILNSIYVLIYTLEKDSHQKQCGKSTHFLFEVYNELQIDNLLMKMMTLSLETHEIPIKKLTMLYTRVLANIFYHGSIFENVNNIINPWWIYEDKIITTLAFNNQISDTYFHRLKRTKCSQNQIYKTKQNKISSVEMFYRKHNTGDCPLAQSIVVGLLRSLLTICNCQSHKKSSILSSTDSFREWQISYQYICLNKELMLKLSKQTLQQIHSYEQFDQNPIQCISEGNIHRTFIEFYSHKIYTTSTIINFFMLLLISFKTNVIMQYSYLLQLISDANGILVFLKFLTDKFQFLDFIKIQIIFSHWNDDTKILKIQQQQKKYSISQMEISFKSKVMLAIYSILNILYISCNNYPQKIKNYLFEYNSYLIIKKLPKLFMINKQKLQQNYNILPSQQQIKQFQKKQQYNNTNNNNNQINLICILTELCYDLLKIQIPFFSKKMKQNSNNMKMIVQIYCRYPKPAQCKQRTPLEKILLKNGIKSKPQTMISCVQELKAIHNQYNNLYYWANDHLILPKPTQVEVVELEVKQNWVDWLENNIWKYYD